MPEPITRSEAIVLIDERILAHDAAINLPRHTENKSVLKEVKIEVGSMNSSLIKIETTFNLLMKFAGAGICIWAIKQIVELVHSLVGR